jgi:hypothetical protein
MFSQHTIFDTNNIDHDPVRRLPDTREPAMRHDVVASRQDELVLIALLCRRGLDELEQPVAPGSR